MKITLKKFANKILDILYPDHMKCVFCGDETSETSIFDTCLSCYEKLPFITNSCARCGLPVSDNNSGVCLDCKRFNYNFDIAKSVFIYKDEVLLAVHKYKYGGCKNYCQPFAEYMAQVFSVWGVEPDFITSVPLHIKKEKQRGYNQAKCLALELSKKFNLPYYDFVSKISDNASQTNFSFEERMKNVLDCYKFDNQYKNIIKGKSVLLIDDVFTTGATTNEVSKILKKAGAEKVFVLTFAHTEKQKTL